jgi:hypothetical protein
MPDRTGGETVKKKKGVGLLIFFLILVIAALIVAVVILLGKNKDTTGNGSLNVDAGYSDSAEKRNVVVNKDNVEQLIEQLAEEDKTPVGRYQVSMTTDWHFADGESISGDAYVENVEANTNSVYFDILLADTEEKIYSSPVIPVGSYLKNIQLDKNLPDGTYDCVIVYSLIDEEQNVLSEVRLTLEINVGE